MREPKIKYEKTDRGLKMTFRNWPPNFTFTMPEEVFKSLMDGSRVVNE